MNQISAKQREDLKNAVTTARVRYVVRHPFWGMIGLRSSIVETDSIETAATDGVNIYYNAEWMVSQYSGLEPEFASKTIQFVIAHEIFHILLDTNGRRGGRDRKLWNIATDYIINRDLKEEFSFIPPNILYHVDFNDPKEWYAERVYDWIKNNSTNNEKDDCLSINMPNGDCKYVKQWDEDIEMFPNLSESEKLDASKAWRASAIRAYQATQLEKNHGYGHGYLSRLIDEILMPKLPWRALLSDFVSTFARDDYSYEVLDPTYLQSNILMPSLFNMTLSGVVAVDTSGSISQDDAKEFISEIAGITSAFPGSELTVLFADTSVHNEQKIYSMPELDLAEGFREGGGGTSFEPTFEYLKDKGIEPTFFAYLTDGYGSYPEETPNYESLWVINNDSYPDDSVPFGRVIRMVD